MASFVWKHFYSINKKDDSAKCKIYNSYVKKSNYLLFFFLMIITYHKFFQKGGGTQNLWPHLRTNHQVVYLDLKNDEKISKQKELEDEKNYKQSTIQVNNINGTRKEISFLSGAANKINIDLKIVEMIITDLQPISFVEDKGFRNLMRLTCPNYEVPGKQKSINVS